MIGPLAKFVRASNLFKIVLRYFGKVWRKSNLCIIKFDWLVALYLFTLLPRNASFLIVKNSVVREELIDFNKSLCRNIFLVSLRFCESPLVRAPPNWHFLLHLPPLQRPGICAVDNFQHLRFGSLQTSSQESVKHTSTFTFIFTLRTIYEVNDTAWYLKRCWPATNNYAILAALLQHNKDKFSKLSAKNRKKINLNKFVPNKW